MAEPVSTTSVGASIIAGAFYVWLVAQIGPSAASITVVLVGAFCGGLVSVFKHKYRPGFAGLLLGLCHIGIGLFFGLLFSWMLSSLIRDYVWANIPAEAVGVAAFLISWLWRDTPSLAKKAIDLFKPYAQSIFEGWMQRKGYSKTTDRIEEGGQK